MGLILRMLGGLLLRLTPSLIAAVLKALGVSVLTFVGMDIAIDQAHNMIKANLTGMPSTAAAFVALLKFDLAVEIIFAAIAGRMTLNALSGSFKKLRLK